MLCLDFLAKQLRTDYKYKLDVDPLCVPPTGAITENRLTEELAWLSQAGSKYHGQGDKEGC